MWTRGELLSIGERTYFSQQMEQTLLFSSCQFLAETFGFTI